MTKNDIRPAGGPPGRGGFHLDKRNGKIMGVAAGLARYTGTDPTMIRIAFVIGALVSLGTAALIYLAIGLIAD